MFHVFKTYIFGNCKRAKGSNKLILFWKGTNNTAFCFYKLNCQIDMFITNHKISGRMIHSVFGVKNKDHSKAFSCLYVLITKKRCAKF